MNLSALFDNPVFAKALWPAFLETLQMVGISAVFTVAVGLPIGILLFATQPGGLAHNRLVNVALGSVVVNITRSIPYAILMLTLVPFTRFLVGTSLGPVAASVSLTIASAPFFARLVESALREVHPGKVDAAHAIGSTRFQTVWKVLLPEAAPALVAAVTTTVVALVGYSAMAGLIGGGGLGRLAYNYGYQRFQPEVMVAILVILLVLVHLVQLAGDLVVRRLDHR